VAERARRARCGHDQPVLKPLVGAHRDQSGKKLSPTPTDGAVVRRVSWPERYDLGAIPRNVGRRAL
jgi:hypothetical protein